MSFFRFSSASGASSQGPQGPHVEENAPAQCPRPGGSAPLPPDNLRQQHRQPQVQGALAPRAGGTCQMDWVQRIIGPREGSYAHTLPSPSNPAEVFKYAMTFDAYKEYGSFDAAKRIAKLAPRTTLKEVRAELFFSARASKHSDNDSYLKTYTELLPRLKRFSKAEPA